MEEKNLGKILINGKMIDLDKSSLDELHKLQEQMSEDEEQKRREIDRLLEELDQEELDQEEFDQEDLEENEER